MSLANGTLQQRVAYLARFFVAVKGSDKTAIVAWLPSKECNATFQKIFDVECVIPRGVIAVNRTVYWSSFVKGNHTKEVYRRWGPRVTPKRVNARDAMMILDDRPWFSSLSYDGALIAQEAIRIEGCMRTDTDASDLARTYRRASEAVGQR